MEAFMELVRFLAKAKPWDPFVPGYVPSMDKERIAVLDLLLNQIHEWNWDGRISGMVAGKAAIGLLRLFEADFLTPLQKRELVEWFDGIKLGEAYLKRLVE